MKVIDRNVKNAVCIGALCFISYLAVYFAKDILSAASPQMLEEGVTAQKHIAAFSSTYFICYAFGQLINGSVGDRIKARYMISFGLICAGICSLLFLNMIGTPGAAQAAYGMMGFCLSMIYGPITKVIAENTDPVYAPRCSLACTFSAFLGSPLAGVAASLTAWKNVFSVNTAMLIIMGTVCFVVFLAFEKKGIVKYNQFSRKAQKSKGSFGEGVKVLMKHRIIKFTLISTITGVVRTAVVFWLPMYLSQYLGFSAEHSAAIFTAATLLLSSAAFIAVFIYEKLKRNMDLTVLLAFSCAAAAFLLVYFVKQPVVNIILLVAAMISSNCASSMLWNRYCPSLRDTGMVSSATGFLDFVSYMSASAASRIFADAVALVGWEKLILIWTALMAVGIIVSLPYSAIAIKIKGQKA